MAHWLRSQIMGGACRRNLLFQLVCTVSWFCRDSIQFEYENLDAKHFYLCFTFHEKIRMRFQFRLVLSKLDPDKKTNWSLIMIGIGLSWKVSNKWNRCAWNNLQGFLGNLFWYSVLCFFQVRVRKCLSNLNSKILWTKFLLNRQLM